MIKTLLILLSIGFSIFNICAQDNSFGALKTKEGVIIYSNDKANSYTLDLQGVVDFSKYPLVRIDGKWFEMSQNLKDEFGDQTEEILKNYMKWELDYLKDQFKNPLATKSDFITHKNFQVNFWQYTNPIQVSKSQIQVIASYFVDFCHNDLVYRFSYPSISGDEKEAKEFLLKLVDNLLFYNDDIDINRLRQSIVNGNNFYIE
jgi:hypothetical protein